jgi:hypothetical protein
VASIIASKNTATLSVAGVFMAGIPKITIAVINPAAADIHGFLMVNFNTTYKDNAVPSFSNESKITIESMLSPKNQKQVWYNQTAIDRDPIQLPANVTLPRGHRIADCT